MEEVSRQTRISSLFSLLLSKQNKKQTKPNNNRAKTKPNKNRVKLSKTGAIYNDLWKVMDLRLEL